MVAPLEIHPVTAPICGTIRPPGSKSLTNRALVVAALADGPSRLTGVLDSQDTRVMIDSLRRLGLVVDHDALNGAISIAGCGGAIPATAAELWLENSGTSIRFLTALCTLGQGRFRLDGNARMRERPLGELVNALNQLGADVRCELDNDCPPVVVTARGLPGGTARVGGNISSQYLSALLMAAPAAAAPVTIEVAGSLVSEPYVEMTRAVMQAFGVLVETPPGPGTGTGDRQRQSLRLSNSLSLIHRLSYPIVPPSIASRHSTTVAATTTSSRTHPQRATSSRRRRSPGEK
jgi:3-phosphoshikimate 1-carboxyvinyltransferase